MSGKTSFFPSDWTARNSVLPLHVRLDEPTGNPDSRTESEVLSVLKKCAKDYSQTLIMITHDKTIDQTADVMLVIEDGKVVNAL